MSDYGDKMAEAAGEGLDYDARRAYAGGSMRLSRFLGECRDDDDDEETEDEDERMKVHRCKDRTCGGLDCATCYGEQAARQYLAELAAEDDEQNNY